MFNPHIQAAMARERRSSFLAEAEADRRATHARQHRRRAGTAAGQGDTARRTPFRRAANWLRSGRSRRQQPVMLRDGSQVLIRPVRSDDAPLLADGFARLSDKSRRSRFLSGKDELTPAELRYLTEVDHHDHEAIGAMNHADGRGVGIARYVRCADDPQAADIAVTVVDDWQGRGLGTELLRLLSDRARQEGICRFTAEVAADNAAVLALLRNLSAGLVHSEFGILEYEVMLAPGEAHDQSGRSRSARDGLWVAAKPSAWPTAGVR
jgi:RimJ/RimL family protein N-acetyltransferase